MENAGKTAEQAAKDTGASVALAKKVADVEDYHFTRVKKEPVFAETIFTISTEKSNDRAKKAHEDFLYFMEHKMGEYAHWSGRIERAAANSNKQEEK
jgi:hypothetical protein